MSLTSDEFKIIRDMVYSESGIFFKEEKTYFVDTRLQSRLQTLGCGDVNEYVQFLRYDKSKAELDQLIDSLTTNETYFFRDIYQIEGFSEEVLPAILKNKSGKGNRTIRIWSAGCSTGEEPYTLSMLLLEKIKDILSWNIQIIATDISPRVLAACRTGVYPPRSLKDVPDYYKEKYFTRTDHTYKINFEVKKLVQFSQLNLNNKALARAVKNMDCIFCRNVLIYFSVDSANQVINNFYDSLNPESFLFLGHSESIHRYSAAFKMVKLNRCFVYKKE